MSILQIQANDNVAVALNPICKGQTLAVGGKKFVALDEVAAGHKLAVQDIHKHHPVIKYGYSIGEAKEDIAVGSWVHTHNLKTRLEDKLEYSYRPTTAVLPNFNDHYTFKGYRRMDGKVGIRNEVWIIPTVGCVNQIAELIAQGAQKFMSEYKNVEGIYAFKHAYGCSQLGRDHAATQKILANLVHHPNAAGVLVLGLGCENNHIEEMKKVIGSYDTNRVKFLTAQEVSDEIVVGIGLVKELASYADTFSREDANVSELVVGLKCGGSDGFSGITANPLLGAFSDKLVVQGGSTILTEVPEMFGAEHILMERAQNIQIFDKTVKLINDFKDYFTSYGQPVYENPSPGNKAGGITTLEEKSLGCVQKGGRSQVVEVLDYVDTVKAQGLSLLNGPGNDLVASTALAAAGCQIILFTTGRGTPLGTVVPMIKISTNSTLYEHKNSWMDFDAGRLISGETMENLSDELMKHVIEVSSGVKTKAENLGFRELSIFKNGVTL